MAVQWLSRGSRTMPKVSESHRNVLDYVQARISNQEQNGLSSRHSYERIWYLCAAFYHGLQFHEWDPSRNLLDYPKMPRWRRRIVANKILPAVQRAVALVYGSEPAVKIAPASPERRDREAARLGQKAWEHFVESTDMRDMDRDILTGTAVTGCYWYKVCWNTSIGPRVVTGSGVKTLGDVQVQKVSPWEYYEDPYVVDKADSHWCAQERLVPIQALQHAFPKFAEYIEPYSSDKQGADLRQRLNGMSSMGAFSASPTSQPKAKHGDGLARFIDFWARPSKDFPKGLHVKLVGNPNSEIIVSGPDIENPHVGLDNTGELELPFFRVGWARGVERKYPVGLVEPLLPIQKEINEIISEIAENRVVSGRPGWLVPTGSGLEGREIPTGPDRKLVYNGMNGNKPEQIVSQPLPPHFWEALNDYYRLFQDIAAQGDAISGKAPASTRTGRAIALLQMQDDSLYGQIRRSFFGTKAKVARSVLILMQNFYAAGDKRTLKIAGAGNEWEVIEFKGADLKGGTDVRMIQDTGLGNTIEARQDRIDFLLERGILRPGDPVHDRIILQALEISSLDDVYANLTIDERETQAEIAVMAREDGTVVELDALPWQDSMKHEELLRRYMKTPEFRALRPEQQMAIIGNWQQHDLSVQAAMLKQQEMGMGPDQEGGEKKPAKPGQPEPGQASPPKPAPSDQSIESAKASGGLNS